MQEEIRNEDTREELAEPTEVAVEENIVEPEKKPSFISEAFDYLEIFVFAACAVLILFSTVIRLCNVDGASMESTLKNGEMLLISDLFYEPQNEDIVVFHQTDDAGMFNKPLVKRVIATEGQWIYIEYALDSAMSVYVSDDSEITEEDLLYEPYANLEPGPAVYANKYKAQVPEGCVFVMGDHRHHSSDSRNPYIGFVDSRRILGKVLLRITPFSEFGTVK